MQKGPKTLKSVNTISNEIPGMRIIKALRQIIHAVEVHSHKLNIDFNITAPQMICLYSLLNSGKITQSELSKQVCMGMSTVNGVIDRLEKKGLVLRQRDIKDRRKVFIHVTKAGKELKKKAPSLLQEPFLKSLRKLSEQDQADIAFSLERVVQLIETNDLNASPNFLHKT